MHRYDIVARMETFSKDSTYIINRYFKKWFEWSDDMTIEIDKENKLMEIEVVWGE